jgi:signal transduction histidine kinase
MRARRAGPTVAALAGVVLTGAAAVVAARGAGDPTALRVIGVAVSVALPFAVGVEVLARYPERVLGRLLVALGVTYFLRALSGSTDPELFAVGRALGQSSFAVLLWLLLAFPSGHIPERRARYILWVAAVTVTLLWWVVVALSADIPAGGFFVPCSPDCPSNSLLVHDDPGAADVLLNVWRATGVLLAAATALVIGRRLMRSTLLMRRVIAPVLIAALARAAATIAFLAGPSTFVTGLGVVSYWAIPLSIALGLLLGRLYDAAALEKLVSGLRRGPSPGELREVMAEALGDPTLGVAYWLPDARAYVRVDGRPAALEDVAGRGRTEIADEDGAPIALLEHDAALLDHPELLEAVSTSTAIALQSNRLEAELAAARTGLTVALDDERRRIERDLHDGAQQRLIALRMKLSVAGQLLDRDGTRARAMLDELRGDVDRALAEVRSLAKGITPPELVERGLGAGIVAVAREAPVSCRVDVAGDVPRLAPAVETGLYFICREALQNAAKHAGPHTRVKISLDTCPEGVRLEIRDDGPGFGDAPRVGSGLENMRRRVADAGGVLELGAAPEGGAMVRVTVPAGAAPEPHAGAPIPARAVPRGSRA